MNSIAGLLLFLLFLGSLRFYSRFWIVLFYLLRLCWFPIFTNLVVVFLFAGTAQGRSIVQEIDFVNTAHRKYITLFVLWLWSFNSLQLAQTALDFSDLAKVCSNRFRMAMGVRLFWPLFIGLLPFLVSIICFVSLRQSVDPGLLGLMLISLWWFLIYMLLNIRSQGLPTVSERLLHVLSLYVYFPAFRRKANPITLNWENLNENAFPKQPYGTHWREHLNLGRWLNWTGHCAAYILIVLWPIFFSRLFGPIGLVFIAMSCYVIVGTQFQYLRQRTRFPVFPIVLLCVLVFTAFSDNTIVGVLKRPRPDPRPNLEQALLDWVKRNENGSDTLNFTLVAAEGGGLRSAYWTYGVLRALQERQSGFFHSLFGVSGVSGGSVGAALFYGEQLEGKTPEILNVPIINQDNVSPMIAALFFREIVQCLVPIDIASLDRSRVMELTFENHWDQKHPGSDFWKHDFLALQHDKRDMPFLFINSVHVESGTSVLLSNVRYDTAQIQSIDLMGYLSDGITLSRAVGLSARFPYMQAAAGFMDADGHDWGHLADGGYFENSGVGTVYQMYLQLRPLADRLHADGKIPALRFRLLFIANVEGLRVSSSRRFLNELNTPVVTVLNSWYARGSSYSHVARLSMGRHNQIDRFFEIRLERKGKNLPLGWFLSLESRQEIVRQIEALEENESFNAFLREGSGK